MNAYDSIERGAADECEPLRGRRPRTFTLTQLLVACVAVCVCSIAATTAVHRLSQEEPPDIEPRPDPPEPLDEPFRKAATTVVNTHQGPSRLANFDLGSAFDDDSAEKKRKAEEKERECDRQATGKKNQRLAQPALGSSPAIDGVHTTSFALGALARCCRLFSTQEQDHKNNRLKHLRGDNC